MTHSNKSAAERAVAERGQSSNPTKTVTSFAVQYTQFLDHNAEVKGPLPEFARDPAKLIALYRAMVRTRTFDQKAIALQRTGQLGTYASSLGQEATFVAIGDAMRPEDVLLPTYRECGAMRRRDLEG
jgi:pyruvate dehydrogenase E1 component alpha subunit